MLTACDSAPGTELMYLQAEQGQETFRPWTTAEEGDVVEYGSFCTCYPP